MYTDWKEIFSELDDSDAGKLIKHVLSYVNDENPITDNKLIKMAFIPIKLALKRDLKKFEEVKKKRSEAGRRSAEIRAEQKLTESTLVESAEQTSTNSTVSDKDNVNVNVKGKVIDNIIYSKSCLRDLQWLETTAMQNFVKIDVIKLFIDTFVNHLITHQEQKKDLKSFKSHFSNWLNKQNLAQFREKKVGKTNQV